jgi:tRNA G26 N,N-dimethylase Trm1
MIINLTDSEFDVLFSYSEDFRKRVRLTCRAPKESPKESANELSFVQSEIRRQFPNDKLTAIKWFRQYCSDTGANFGFDFNGYKYPGLADSKEFVEQALQK